MGLQDDQELSSVHQAAEYEVWAGDLYLGVINRGEI